MTAMPAGSVFDPFTDFEGLPDEGCRYEQVDGSLLVHRDPPFTVGDLDALPEDGRRYELLDGVLLVTPPPGYAHQHLLGRLFVALLPACPPGLEPILGFGYRFNDRNFLIPDVLVARGEDISPASLLVAPLLAVEIASRSTARIDRGRKREIYEARGVASYWLIDPKRPSVTVLELREGRYEEVAIVTGDEELVVERPFPVRLVPSELAAG